MKYIVLNPVNKYTAKANVTAATAANTPCCILHILTCSLYRIGMMQSQIIITVMNHSGPRTVISEKNR